jgi:UDP-3-O-[3-hydroxymyristoyl] glucosamine N-acyltransferase
VVVACPDPYLAMALLSADFARELSTLSHSKRPEISSIHPTAVIHPSVQLGKQITVAAHCVVDEGSKIGDGSVLYPGVVIGPRVTVGEDSVFFPGVVIYENCEIGNRVRIHGNSVIGADGFGYAPKKSAQGMEGHQKIYHLGRVVVGDDVEIGASSTVDRSTLGDTVIEKHAKIDNQVQIGHNAHVGEGAIICGGSALAGRARLGRYAVVGGLTGVTNAVTVGDGASVAALSLVTRDVAPGSTAVGNPQREYAEHFRAHAALNRLVSERGRETQEKK